MGAVNFTQAWVVKVEARMGWRVVCGSGKVQVAQGSNQHTTFTLPPLQSSLF